METFNLVLSGGGVRAYAHLGVYKYCFEKEIRFKEIVSVSGGALLAPFIYLRWQPDNLITLFKKAGLHKMLFPFWFVPDKFEFLFVEPCTSKLGMWIEKQFTKSELSKIHNSTDLHIMATQKPVREGAPAYTDMLKITGLKDSIAATCAISGIFKPHKVNGFCFIDGAHWNSAPIFFDFKNLLFPLLAVNLGYSSLSPSDGSLGRISKVFRGLEISSYARFQEDLKRWDEEKSCNKRGELLLITPELSNINSLNFDVSEKEINSMIDAGYRAASKGFALKKDPSLA